MPNPKDLPYNNESIEDLPEEILNNFNYEEFLNDLNNEERPYSEPEPKLLSLPPLQTGQKVNKSQQQFLIVNFEHYNQSRYFRGLLSNLDMCLNKKYLAKQQYNITIIQLNKATTYDEAFNTIIHLTYIQDFKKTGKKTPDIKFVDDSWLAENDANFAKKRKIQCNHGLLQTPFTLFNSTHQNNQTIYLTVQAEDEGQSKYIKYKLWDHDLVQNQEKYTIDSYKNIVIIALNKATSFNEIQTVLSQLEYIKRINSENKLARKPPIQIKFETSDWYVNTIKNRKRKFEDTSSALFSRSLKKDAKTTSTDQPSKYKQPVL